MFVKTPGTVHLQIAIQYLTAIENDQDIIVTRNQVDFKESKIPVMTAAEFIKSIKN